MSLPIQKAAALDLVFICCFVIVPTEMFDLAWVTYVSKGRVVLFGNVLTMPVSAWTHVRVHVCVFVNALKALFL